MLALGGIKREASPFASPLTVVRKKDGSVRICLDARGVNQRMVADCETPRPPEDLLQSFQSVRFMSTIDLRSSYWQIPLSPESTQYTAFLFNGQSYTYQVLPFGLKTAVGSFSRAMNVILGPEVAAKDARWQWTAVEQWAFDKTRELFLDTVLLKFPDFSKTFYLQTDGSGVALGVELYQLLDDGEHGVIGFASRILREPELLYTVTEKELLAIIFGLQKYPPGSSGLAGRSQNFPVVAPVLTSGGEAISAVFEASGLRELGDHFTNLRQLQLDDIFLGPMFRAKLGEGVAPDDSTPRLALSQVLTEEVIQAFHEQYGHFGVSKIYSMVRRYFFFPNMRRRIERLVKSCDLCQKTKYPNRGLCGEMNAIIAGNPGDLVTVDYYGPLPPSRSRVSYILVVSSYIVLVLAYSKITFLNHVFCVISSKR
ncbi:hypothetical protein MTP99_006962 [Tenebrio molitor]|nr:hypothetical protein MTP99_006962 [Tenebrio molitor]